MRTARSGRLSEMLRFLVTGGVCFLIEFACLVLLREKLRLDTLIATPIAFLVSVLVNYLLCVRWVFPGAKEQSRAAKLGFLVTSFMGLFLNELLMFLFRHLLGEDQLLFTLFSFPVTMYMLNKVLATALVLIWNYFTKRYLLRRRT